MMEDKLMSKENVDEFFKEQITRELQSATKEFEIAINILEERGYSITPNKDGEFKLVWIEDGDRFETFETAIGIIYISENLK